MAHPFAVAEAEGLFHYERKQPLTQIKYLLNGCKPLQAAMHTN